MHDFKELDQEFLDKVAATPGGEHVSNCYLCGTCTAGCPVSVINNDYNPRRIMRMLLLGMKNEILSSPDIWMCSQCHTCVAHCPQDVRFADVMRVLRQMAVEEGYASRELAAALDEMEEDFKKKRIEKIRELTGR